ncbi:MAG: restriction endonuclease subunit S [Caldisericales bacterium]|nr:restriction endonuclease subunit S [bacterium]
MSAEQNKNAKLEGVKGEWQEILFSQATIINPKVQLLRGTSYPFIDMGAINGNLSYVSATKRRIFKGGGSRFITGDILMARITPCLENGKISRFYSGSNTKEAHGSTEFIVVRGRDGISDSTYAYYLLKSKKVHEYAIAQMTGTSGRQRVPVGAFDHLKVKIPPLEEQKAIAHILGTLDDKIELNRRTNEMLEAMAQALFKFWFVDFGPVRAKMEGRWRRGQSLPGLPAHLFDLFPDRLVDSELGEIPEGWEVSQFTNTIEIIGGGTPKTSVAEYWGDEIPWFSVADTPSKSDMWVMDTEKKVTRKGIENSSTKILPIGTTIISARGTVGKVALVGVPMAMNQSCYGLRSKVGSQGIFCHFVIRKLISVLQQNTHGSIFDTITRDTLGNIAVLIPPLDIIDKFEIYTITLTNSIRENLNQSHTLAAIRDTLLPKLISGELRVKQTREE